MSVTESGFTHMSVGCADLHIISVSKCPVGSGGLRATNAKLGPADVVGITMASNSQKGQTDMSSPSYPPPI